MKISSLLSVPLFASLAWTIEINVNDKESIKKAAGVAARKLREIYPNKETWFIPGEFGKIKPKEAGKDEGYYWWEAGAAMGAWIDYWAYTGDTQYNDIVTEAMLFQVGDDKDYQPANQTLSLGNDDQAFWGIAAMMAAERGFKDPPEDKPQWLALVQAVFNRQASRWDNGTCGGGLRWQVFSSNKGYDYKNSISNGAFFHIAARLARYTGNHTYANWAETTWDWSRQIGILSNEYQVFDGSHIPECVVSSRIQWTYNAGVYLAGCAALYDYYKVKGDQANAGKWREHTEKMFEATDKVFFNYNLEKYPANVMSESACEFPVGDAPPLCNTDQRSFKAYLARWMAFTHQLVDTIREPIMIKLRATAEIAAKSCDGAPGGDTCGLQWGLGKYDNSPYGIAVGGLGEHMGVMEVIQSLLVPGMKVPLVEKTGTSKGDVNAGSGTSLTAEDLMQTDPSTTGDRAGAGILTTICLGALLGMTYWLIKE